MKHLNRDQLLEWVETGRADENSRAHLKACPDCARQLASFREVFQMLAHSDAAPDLDESQALQFRHDLSRKIRLIPEPGPVRAGWDLLRRLVVSHYVMIGVLATAVLIFSIVSVFKYRYDTMSVPEPTQMAREAPETGNSEAGVGVPVEDAEELVASQNLQAIDLFEAAVDSEGASGQDMGVGSEFSSDPFQHIPDLRPEEVAQLKALIKKQLKS
jgi:hypothetical protein